MKYGIPLSVITSTIAACVMFGAYSRKVDLEYDKRVRGIITLSIVSILAFLKRTPRLQQKLSYQQRFVNAVKDAKRWKEWSLKQAKRQEDDQKRKSENFSQMVMRGRQQTESEDVMNIST